MARVLWSKVLEPLRAALMASIICQKVASSVTDLSKDELLVRPPVVEASSQCASPRLSSPPLLASPLLAKLSATACLPLRQAQASKYESWAIGLLRHDHRLDHDSFAKLLMQLPRAVRPPTLANGSARKSRKGSKGSASATDSEASASSAQPLVYLDRWPESPLENAIAKGTDYACKEFIATRQVREVLNSVFSGYEYRALERVELDDTDQAQDDDIDDEEFAGLDPDYFLRQQRWLRTGHMRTIYLPIMGKVYIPSTVSDKFPTLGRLPVVGRVLALPLAVLSIPKVKMMTNLCASLAYYVFFVGVLVGWPPWYGHPLSQWMILGRLQPIEKQKQLTSEGTAVASSVLDFEGVVFSQEGFLWVWTLLRMIEEFKQIVRQGAAGYKETRRFMGWFAYFGSGGNLLDLWNICSILMAMIIRLYASLAHNPWEWTKTFQVSQCFYAISSITLIVRFAYGLAIYESFGVLLLMFTRVLRDSFSWIAVLLFGSFGVGIAYTILMPGDTYGYDRSFFRPFWGLLGNFDVHSIDEYFELDGEASTVRETTMALTFMYTFGTTILLVNLLIAQISNTYEAMKAESIQLWLAQRIDLILEFKDDTDPLPPPLSAFYLLLYTLPSTLYSIASWVTAATSGYKHGDNTVDAFRGFRIEMGPRTSAAVDDMAMALCTGYLREVKENDISAADSRMMELNAKQEAMDKKMSFLQVRLTQSLEALGEVKLGMASLSEHLRVKPALRPRSGSPR